MTANGLSEPLFRRFQALIYQQAGVYLSPAKRFMLSARLAKRLSATGISNYANYLRRVIDDSGECARMLHCVTTHETRFFRERKQFEYLQSVLLEQWKREAYEGLRRRCVRVWSAGCATGEEPYSVAMSLLAGLGAEWDVSVLASDVSTEVLETAREAVWPLTRSADIPPGFLRAFMLRGHGAQVGRMKAGPEIRSVTKFAHVNLHESSYPIDGSFDLVLCRNVLIYFDASSRRAAVDRLVERLRPGGWLFVGHAETLAGVTARVVPVAPTIYRRPERAS